jgi:hypothetical protein
MISGIWSCAPPSELGGDTRHARFEREAALDRWVQANGDRMREAYEGLADGKRLLAFATSSWVRERADAPDVEHGIAAIAAGVAATTRSNLEAACSRLLWATRRERVDASAFDAAEHYTVLALATAKRAPEREAAECVSQAIRFVRAGRAADLDARDAALDRIGTLAEKRLSNFPALVGAHFPFWSFPFAFRWDDPAPDGGRGKLGASDPVDASVRGLFTLAYRRGRTRGEIAEALERCACAIRRLAPGGLEQARATSAVSELARDVRDSWAVRDAIAPRELVERIAPRMLSLPFSRMPGDFARAEQRASQLLVPVLRDHWPDLDALVETHRTYARGRPADLISLAA